MKEFRLIVNESIRIALLHDARSRGRLGRIAYADMSLRHDVYKQYIPSAFEVALTSLKAHRRRIRNKQKGSVPYLRRLVLKAENQSYHLDSKTGVIRLPIRAREHVELHLPMSEWHRRILSDLSYSLGSLVVTPQKVVVNVRKDSPPTYEPSAVIALDTNEDSLDGLVAECRDAGLLTLPLDGVREIQATHFRRRRRLARKKANDRRIQRGLLDREGTRERNRVRQRLHCSSKSLVRLAKSRHAAIVLENLTLVGATGRSRRMNRRLSSWPRREIHRQIEYKAALEGVPVIKVNHEHPEDRLGLERGLGKGCTVPARCPPP